MRKYLLSLLALLLVIGIGSSAFAQPYNYGNLPRDPCDTAFMPPQSALINVPSAQTLQLVAAPTAPAIYGGGTAAVFVCGYQFTATGTYAFVTGTGTNCATGQTALTGTMITQVSPVPNTSPQFEGSLLTVPGGQAVCITTGAAATGWLWFGVE